LVLLDRVAVVNIDHSASKKLQPESSAIRQDGTLLRFRVIAGEEIATRIFGD